MPIHIHIYISILVSTSFIRTYQVTQSKREHEEKIILSGIYLFLITFYIAYQILTFIIQHKFQ